MKHNLSPNNYGEIRFTSRGKKLISTLAIGGAFFTGVFLGCEARERFTTGETVACATGTIDDNAIDGATKAIAILESKGHEVGESATIAGQVAQSSIGDKYVQSGDTVKLCVDDHGHITSASITPANG